MTQFRLSGAVALFGVLVVVASVSVALVLAAPNNFENELNFLKSLNVFNLLHMEEEVVKPKPTSHNSTPNLIARFGYPLEKHSVKTEDGYLLTLYRIPNPGKPVVFLQHGLLSSSADWVILGPKKALATVLYDAGYDVWLGNSRGSTYSRAHATMSPNSAKFWDFSWHEIGVYDLPACIDDVLKITKQKDLLYIGHSQGTTAFFVMMSQKPEYNAKVRAMFAMAPVAYLNEIKSFPIRLFSLATDQLSWLTNLIGMHEFLPSNFFIRKLSDFLCTEEAATQLVCSNALFLICGFDSDQLNKTMLPEIMENVPAGAATKQIIHYGQLVRGGPVFRQYDHGWFTNMFVYGSWEPPSYDLSKITTQVHIHYGENDLLAVPEGVSLLHKLLPNSVEYSRVPYDQFNHLDFLFATDARNLVYDRVVNKIKEIVPTNSSLSTLDSWNSRKNQTMNKSG